MLNFSKSPKYWFHQYLLSYGMLMPDGSDHEVTACYLELYEEGEVEHICISMVFGIVSYYYQLLVVVITWVCALFVA